MCVSFKFDGNEALDSLIGALESGSVSPFWIFLLLVILMFPWIIPAVSKAIAEQRALSHKRDLNLQKLKNAVAQRRIGAPAASSKTKKDQKP